MTRLINLEEREILLHMLGLTEFRPRRSTRNYYASEEDGESAALLSGLEEDRLVKLVRHPTSWLPCRIYAVTEAGKDAVRAFHGPFTEDKR